MFCLTCSRALAGEAAMESAPGDSSREELAQIRRRGLIEFEISRLPQAPNRAIANACRTSTGTVAAVRKAAAKPRPGVPRPAADGGR
jgi:hypothetical protein